MKQKRRIIFLYPDPPGFSGQRNAAEMVLKSLGAYPHFELVPIKLSGLPKTGKGVVPYARFLVSSLHCIARLLGVCAFGRADGVFVALSQTRKTLAREKLFLRMIRLVSRNRQMPIAFRIDSSLFTTWEVESPVAVAFREILEMASVVAVLGPTQKSHLDANFVTEHADTESWIVPNTCEIDVCTEDDVLRKQDQDAPINVLHLSSLMEAKGYCDLVDSIDFLTSAPEIVLCGYLTHNEYATRFDSLESQRKGLEGAVTKHSNLSWVEGAIGEKKRKLFETAQVFVLPSWYPVEAQPLVLLEAMASGCVVITSTVGEIPFMVDEKSAVLLKTTDAESIAHAIDLVARDNELRKRTALAGRKVFLEKFHRDKFASNWKKLFEHVYCSHES